MPDRSYHEEVKSPNLGDALGGNDKEGIRNLPEEAMEQLSPEEHVSEILSILFIYHSDFWGN